MAQQQIPLTLTIHIASVLRPVSAILPDGVEGQPYSVQLEVEGGIPPYDFAESTLPPGLSVSPTGLLSGTPTVPAGPSTIPPSPLATVIVDVKDSGT